MKLSIVQFFICSIFFLIHCCTRPSNNIIFSLVYAINRSYTMGQNNDFDKFWKQIVYETLDDDNDEEIMNYLCVMQQQEGNKSEKN